MPEQIVVAIIGAAGLILAGWIQSRRKEKRRMKVEMVGRDRIHGDAIGGHKFVSNENVHVTGPDGEKKSGFVYFLEKIFAFGFTLVLTGAIFGGIGLAAAQEAGAVAGVVLALIAALVNAGNVKRTKGLV